MSELGFCGEERRKWLIRAAALAAGTFSTGGLASCGGGSSPSSVSSTAALAATPGSTSSTVATALAVSPTAAPSVTLTAYATPPAPAALPGSPPLPVGVIPAWVPSAAWTWTPIPNTVFNSFMKDDSTGIAPASGPEPSGGTNNATYPYYAKETSFGGPSYSRKNHELYLFGGGHAATTLNALSRWNLNQDIPDMTLLVPSTTSAMRQQYWLDTTVRASGYWPDGKPKSAHMYHALQYMDALDQLVAIGLAFGTDPVTDSVSWNIVASYARGSAVWDPAGSWPSLPTEINEGPLLAEAPAFASFDGSAVYYYRDTGGAGPWRKLDALTQTIVPVGGRLNWWNYTVGSARHDINFALLAGGSAASGGYQFKLLDLTTGISTPMNSVGYPCPTNASIKDLVWISTYGYWVGWFVDVVTDNAAMGVQKLIKFQQTSSTDISATLITTIGSPPIGNGGCLQGMYWDDVYGCILFVGGMGESLYALKAA